MLDLGPARRIDNASTVLLVIFPDNGRASVDELGFVTHTSKAAARCRGLDPELGSQQLSRNFIREILRRLFS